MEMKKIARNILLKATDKMINVSTASLLGYGVEEMPQSMKEKR